MQHFNNKEAHCILYSNFATKVIGKQARKHNSSVPDQFQNLKKCSLSEDLRLLNLDLLCVIVMPDILTKVHENLFTIFE